MLSHYVKISFRELLKYRTQSLVSIIGLAVGFTAFILGGYWLWWETHFDNFHPEADRLYCLALAVYSLVSLATEQRRKEIAIRKVNGATFRHILQLFFREYFLLVTLGNAFALPVGYLLTRRWLETYANHTTLPAWLYLLVFGITSGIVLLSIFRQVKRAATTNPAEVIKTE